MGVIAGRTLVLVKPMMTISCDVVDDDFHPLNQAANSSGQNASAQAVTASQRNRAAAGRLNRTSRFNGNNLHVSMKATKISAKASTHRPLVKSVCKGPGKIDIGTEATAIPRQMPTMVTVSQPSPRPSLSMKLSCIIWVYCCPSVSAMGRYPTVRFRDLWPLFSHFFSVAPHMMRGLAFLLR